MIRNVIRSFNFVFLTPSCLRICKTVQELCPPDRRKGQYQRIDSLGAGAYTRHDLHVV
jgi:hypothetical protein